VGRPFYPADLSKMKFLAKSTSINPRDGRGSTPRSAAKIIKAVYNSLYTLFTLQQKNLPHE